MTTLQARLDPLGPSVLVVSLDRTSSAHTADLLTRAGYRAKTAAGFEQATARMTRHTPDLLVTDVRLGAYNGLHLVHHRHLAHRRLPSIVTHTEADTALRPEATRAGAACLLGTQLDDALVPLADRLLDRLQIAPSRRQGAASRRSTRRATRAVLAPSAL